MTTPDQWPRIKEIVGAALECPQSERTSYLDAACSEDEALRAEVEALIAAYERSWDFSSPGWASSFPEKVEVAQTIGPYRLVRELGVGGMGQVWLAEQTEPVRRLVAIKLVRANLYHPEIRARFLAERQSLALMNHPYIAKVFEAGTTQSGQLYFVMEYVDGSPISEYCDRKRFTIEQRLELLQMVCEGVQHAHLKAIIHRDLKPSNILVEEIDGKATPRIIDFGVAKAVSPDLDADRTQTRQGSVIGTLQYMSLEQADPGKEDIDARTDGYSLGVILYELLTGALPHQYREVTWYEAVRQLREQEPPRPSVRLQQAADADSIAHNRSAEPGNLVRRLRGDLDSIVLKAIEVDRNRRYETPSALSADIEHFLRNEPVAAYTAGFVYRARKYVRRHRTGALVVTVAILLLVGFTIAQTWQLRNTRRQRDRADRIAGFMTDIFKVSDPSESRGSSITARQVLDQSAHRVEAGEGLDSVERQQLLQVMARTYLGLGLYSRAHDLARQVYEDRRRSFGPSNRSTLEAMADLAEIATRQGRDSEAQGMIRQAIELETRALGAEDPLTLKSRQSLAVSLTSHAHYAEAEKLEREIVPIESRKLGPFHAQTFASLNTLARAISGQSRFVEAENYFRKLLVDERQTLGPDHPYVLVTMHNLANMLLDCDRLPEAEALYRETNAIERRVLGPEHPDTADTMTTLANTVTRDHLRRVEAEALYRQSLAIEQRAVGPDHPYTTRAQEGLANNLSSQKRLPEAQSLLQQVFITRQRTLGPDNTDTLLTGYNLAVVLSKRKLYAQAEQEARRIYERQSQVLDANDPDTLASETFVGQVLLKEGRPQEAEELLRSSYTAQLRLLGPEHEDTAETRESLAHAIAQQGRYVQAQALYQGWIAALEKDRKADLPEAWYDFAIMAALTGHRIDALDYLGKASQTGFRDLDSLASDEEFASLRKDPRFRQIVHAIQQSAPATSVQE